MRSRVPALFAITVAAKTPSFKPALHSPKFLELGRNAKLETVATGFGFTVSSGERINKILRIYMDCKKEEVIALDEPDGNTFDQAASVHRIVRAS